MRTSFFLADVSRVEILSVWLPKNGRALFAAFARFNCVFKTLSHGSFEQAALILLSSDKAIQAVSHTVAQALLKELKFMRDEAFGFGAGSAATCSFVNSVFGDVAFLKLGLHGPRPTLQSGAPEMEVEFQKKLFKSMGTQCNKLTSEKESPRGALAKLLPRTFEKPAQAKPAQEQAQAVAGANGGTRPTDAAAQEEREGRERRTGRDE